MNRPIVYKRSMRAKNLYIKIKPFEDVIVSFPFFMKQTDAKKFVDEKSNWIKKKLFDIVQIEESHNRSLDGYQTRFSKLIFKQTDASRASYRISKNSASIFIPHELDEYNEEVRKCIHRAINKIYLDECEFILPQRVEELSKKYNLPYRSLTFKYTKTKWGMCSANNDITLNPHLLRLPNKLIDYVILHELTHTKVKNHGKIFWNAMLALNKNSKKLDKEINRFSLRYI